VYPAAGLVDYFRGDCLVLMDRQKTPRDEAADILIREPIAEVFGKIKA
jgi:NAD-dependent deacetylase